MSSMLLDVSPQNSKVLQRVAPAVVFLMTMTLIGKALALGRETLTAGFFGASATIDAYVLAAGLPTLLFAALGTSLGASLIPVFTWREQEGGSEAAFRTINNLVNALLLVLTTAVVATELWAPQIVQLIAPGFDVGTFRLAVRLCRWILPSVIFMNLAGVFTGMLQVRLNFVVPAVAALASSATLVSSMVVAGLRKNIELAAVGALLASVVLFASQVPSALKLGYRYRRVFDWRDAGLRRMGKLSLTVLLSTGIGQISLIVGRALASLLETGSMAALNYAMQIQLLPIQIVGVAISTVAFPMLSQHAAKDDKEGFIDLFSRSARWTILSLVPIAIAMMMLEEPIIRLIYQHGAFDAHATRMTAFALSLYGPGILFIAMRDLSNRTIFALGGVRVVIAGAVVEVLSFIGLGAALLLPLKLGGLALASSAAPLFSCLLILSSIGKRLSVDFWRESRVFLGKSTIAGGAMVGALVAAQFLVPKIFDPTETHVVAVLTSFGLRVCLGFGVFLALGWMLNIHELRLLPSSINQIMRTNQFRHIFR